METFVDGQGKSIWCGSNQTLAPEIPLSTKDFCNVASCIGGQSAGDGFVVFPDHQASYCEGHGTRPLMMHFVCM
jgi:hypothetical protein